MVTTNKSYDTIDGRQSYVVRTGKEWEKTVEEFVNRRLREADSDLVVVDGGKIPKNSKLWDKLAIPVGKPGSKKKIWGDVDLVVIEKDQNPIGVISCKISLHGRLSESLFYSVVLKDLIPGIKFVLATNDKGRQQKGDIWQSEWGSEEKPTKDRRLGSHYLDGVYILNENTKMGGMIKPLMDLPKDLMKWHKKSLQQPTLY